MKKLSFFITMLMLFSSAMFAQVGINADNSAPNSSAGLDVSFTNKGLLPPRIALTAINSADPITNPAIGLLVYNTATTGTPPNNVIPGNYYWNGTRWIAVNPPQGVNAGDMLYWNGTQWVGVPAGSNGQVLTFNNGVPTWGGVQLPILNTTSVSNIGVNSANSGGNIASDGGSPVTVRGVCWSISPNPTTADSKTNDGSGAGSFTSNLTGLTTTTLYYVRAYAINSEGTIYGNQVSFTTHTYAIGLSYGGGIIFYLDGTYQHGLIAAPSDQSLGATWGCQGTSTGATGTAIGTGQANTTAIITACSVAGIAARICDDLVLNGYDDWFLPSKDELNQMYTQKNVIGGLTGYDYWSSSEYNISLAWPQIFDNGQQSYDNKYNAHNVRAIRAF